MSRTLELVAPFLLLQTLGCCEAQVPQIPCKVLKIYLSPLPTPPKSQELPTDERMMSVPDGATVGGKECQTLKINTSVRELELCGQCLLQ